MTILSIVQNACSDLGIAQPTTVIGNTDNQVVQLLSLANREGKDLSSRGRWTALQKQATFTMALAESQGALNSTVVTAGDFDYILNNTIWDRTLGEPIFGPAEAIERQLLKAFPVTGPYKKFWIQGGILYLNPAPTTANTGAFEYVSTHWCESNAGAGRAAWAADTDVGRLNEEIMTLGLVWRWLKRKGLDYAEDFATYEKRVTDALARDGGKRTLSMDSSPYQRVPGIFVPIGNWPV
jgi:hypothetical protein